jgi:putative transcriptional regulator
MDKALFNDLVTSLHEARAIAQGTASAGRRTVLSKPLDAKEVREQTALSQKDFAALLRVSVKTLQNWEQHRRSPTGPAEALLTIVSRAPQQAIQYLHA